jgi:hypothetical protein
MLSPLYGQLSPLRVPTKAVRKVSDDADANAYLLAVEEADGQELETGVITAVETFITGCKSDGIWSALKASCILAGARTLNGALVPLVGTAPTNANFVSGDYNRESGLIGNGSTKSLITISNSSLDQNNNHIFAKITDEDQRTVSAGLMGTQHGITGSNAIRRSGSTGLQYHPMSASLNQISGTNVRFQGGCGLSRSLSSSFIRMNNGSASTISLNSQINSNQNISIFRNTNTTNYTNSRILFYSIGESIDLTALNSRVSTLMTALAAAIT